ncbi:type I restriction endonuclease subunit R [Paenirhodobacter hankyongi]|uniref:Type I restriction endonuclease subunit R n=1 Tax=Paenirhodobacter hankyongi TaxID=2294033 RepID=A0A421BXM3_9RHOB|nr:type I restriction endonuclease [Sinirhodobacter hankyongi]RLL73044.1 type I restriction endonuclease subunit R [Sinirhodobacter hankyongi]
MATHREIGFEEQICADLAAQGWLYAEPGQAGDARSYDRVLALYPEDLIAWAEATQPRAWAEALARHGLPAILARIRKQLDARGTLDLLRQGVEIVGLRAPLMLAQFRPASGMNPEITARYDANRLRVLRQVHYSEAAPNRSIDLVLFLNGIPVATTELKTDFTQSVQDAVDQYRFDRKPQEKGGKPEPLLSFPGGALVHFAVSDRLVRMTTQLAGPATRFLPFDRGDHGAAGNPVNPDGHRTAYLWQEIWARDSWLEILGRYMVGVKDARKKLVGAIFPRYHQLDATRCIRAAVLKEGPGGKYLIQHSAGSGKTNSIAWTAHQLADLHDAGDRKMFSTVIVVSDRNVIDTQLQEAVFAFERTTGVVETITREHGAKRKQLTEALNGEKKIVVCTIQTFPALMDAAEKLASTAGKSFAVIADEAHSSQTGGAASALKQVLSAEEKAELEDGGGFSSEDVMNATMSARAAPRGISFVAFTATPKGKTLELFGRRPDPDAPAGPGNLPAPFHVYSMRQAIEEGFILDVLQNYTPYDLAFRLSANGREIDDREVERSKGTKALMQWVQLHPTNIAQKVAIVVEHFRTTVMPLLNGHAKAMVVTASRKEAVRWQIAMRKYIEERGYGLGTLVAFSGEVSDPESGPDPFSETSKTLNPGLRGDIRETFKGPAFHLLIVANKFQTGFDQPLLCGMYVDRRLAGIQAVQTLSRLNRAYEKDGVKKDTTYILDFANSAEDILSAFRTYYETAELEDVTDPNQVLDLRAQLDGLGYYDDGEVDRVVRAALDPKASHGALSAALEPVADRLLKQFAAARQAEREARARGGEDAVLAAKQVQEALILFRSNMGAYVRLYAFLSQIFDYGSTDIEARSIFYRHLIPVLEFGREREGVDLSKIELSFVKSNRKDSARLQLSGPAEKLKPMTETGSASVQDKEKARLSEIVARLNDLFSGLTEGDEVSGLNTIHTKVMENEQLRQQAASNNKEQFANSPLLKAAVMDAIISSADAQDEMTRQLLSSDATLEGFLAVMTGPGQLYEALRGQG